MNAPPSTTRPPARLLREKDAADILGLSPKTLARWRWSGKGPRYRKFPNSSAVRYAIEDLELFISNGAVAR
jgi:hypothetical protein